jgi:O-antigen/teichoic acid export membrane protein
MAPHHSGHSRPAVGGIPPLTVAARAQEAAKGLSKLFVAQLLGRIVRFSLFNVILARALGLAGYGLFALVFWALQVLQVASSLGLPNGVYRFVPVSFGRGDRTGVTAYLRQSLVLSVVASLVTAAVACFLSPFIARTILGVSAAQAPFAEIVLALPFLVVLTVMASAFGALERPGHLAVVRELLLPGALILTIGIPFLSGPTLRNAIFGTVAGCGLAAILSVGLVARVWPDFFTAHSTKRRVSRELLTFSLPTTLSGFAMFLQLQLDRVMIAHFLPERDVGLYSVAAGVAAQLFVIPVAFNSVFAARMASTHAAHQFQELRRLLTAATRWSLSVCLPAAGLTSLLATVLLRLSGRGYVSGRPILLVLVWGFALAAPISGVAGKALAQAGRQNVDMVITVFTVLLNVLLNVLLIQVYGSMGAALATAITFALAAGLRLVAARIAFGFWPADSSPWRPLSALAAASLPALLANRLAGAWVSTAAFVVIYFSVWIALAYHEEDRAVIAFLRKTLLPFLSVG